MRKKILFVTHALESLYGAATSLRLLLENYTGIEAELMVPRSFRHPRDLAQTASSFPSVRRVHEISMPVDLNVVGIGRSLADKAHGVVHWMGWLRDRQRYQRMLQDYDLVHFNSVVLHHMLLPGTPAITHIREIITHVGSPVIQNLANGLGLIFIDSTTRQPFAPYESRMNAITLNNPVDMRGTPRQTGGLRIPVRPTATVFSMIGQVHEIKGVDFVIDAFRRSASPGAVLLIVGDGPKHFMARCRALAGDDPRVVFWGEEADIKSVYAVTDYVVRGDPQPCVGRTVYEGLYAGCRVILPGPGRPGLVFEAERFGDSIFWYTPGDATALAGTFAACSNKKVATREYLNNIGPYVQSFDGFMASCLRRRSALIR